MAVNRVATALVYMCAIASLQDEFVTCNPVKRSGEGSCQGAQCAQDTASSGHSLDTATLSVPTTDATCVADPGLERRTMLLEDAANTWAATLPPMLDTLKEISNSLKTPPQPVKPMGMDCSILYDRGYNTSGIYKIAHHHQSLAQHKSFYAHCDMETDGGGWTVFQRRSDGSTDFYRGWEAYTNGFGHLDGEHWMGLDNLYLLTSLAKYELRIDLESFDGLKVYAKYDDFRISDEIDDYKLFLGSYSGTAGDAFSAHNGKKFTTKDKDNDWDSSQNCAQRWAGAWWYYDCHVSNLNGLYLGASQSDSRGIVWQTWKETEVLKGSEMKIRRKN